MENQQANSTAFMIRNILHYITQTGVRGLVTRAAPFIILTLAVIYKANNHTIQ